MSSGIVAQSPNYLPFVDHVSRTEARFLSDNGVHSAMSGDALVRDWSRRETRRIVESDLIKVNASRTELSKLEFRRLAAFIFAEFPLLRRQALLAGKIRMGDGRVVTRRSHVDMTRRVKAA